MTRQFLPQRHALNATQALGLARALEACGNAEEARPLAMEALRIRTELNSRRPSASQRSTTPANPRL